MGLLLFILVILVCVSAIFAISLIAMADKARRRHHELIQEIDANFKKMKATLDAIEKGLR